MVCMGGGWTHMDGGCIALLIIISTSSSFLSLFPVRHYEILCRTQPVVMIPKSTFTSNAVKGEKKSKIPSCPIAVFLSYLRSGGGLARGGDGEL